METLRDQIVLAAVKASAGDLTDLKALHAEVNLLEGPGKKAAREALKVFNEIEDTHSRNLLFCFIWERSGHAWNIPSNLPSE